MIALLLAAALTADAVEPVCRVPEDKLEEGFDRSDPWQRLAATCNAGYCFAPEEIAGLIWCGNALSFQEAAEAAAPILWFSPDEPLLKDANRAWAGALPERFPWDKAEPRCFGGPEPRCLGRAYYLLSRSKGGNDPPGAA